MASEWWCNDVQGCTVEGMYRYALDVLDVLFNIQWTYCILCTVCVDRMRD